MKIDPKEFRVHGGKEIRLSDWPTRSKPLFRNKAEYENILQRHIQRLSNQQNLLYACNQYAILVIFQAMDAGGKDSAIKHVMSGVNPQGCEVFSFRHPGEEDLEHDFLWRTTERLPERGRIGIFNRSYYEEVLIVRVHPHILRGEHIPAELVDPKAIWRERYRSINNLERHLYLNGTRIVKFYLHVSKEEQRKRLLKRIEDPSKNWKLSLPDFEERKRWDDYMAAYEACITETSTPHAPWYIVPADDKKNARLIISEALLEAMEKLKLKYPELNEERRRELQAIRNQLES